MDMEKDATILLAEEELAHYHLQAELLIEKSLPSFEIRVEKGQFIIAAPDSIELLYGVYDLAERAGGYCFFEPGVDLYEEKEKKTALPDGCFVKAHAPLLKRRGLIQEFPFNKDTRILFDYMAKNKLNYLLVWMKYYDELSEELKEYAAVRGIVIESGHHNFDYWIPGKKYGKLHPEFFAVADGKRITPTGGKGDLLMSEQLCTTNKELRNEIVKNMLAYCEAHPEVKVISLVPNDGFGWCECEECSKFYNKEDKGDFYNLSRHVYKADAIYHDLIKDISARLHKVREDITLTFVAYVNYCRPAEGFSLEKNSAVHMAPYWRCINHPIDDPSCYINSRYADDLKAWAKVKNGGEINVYEYYMGVNFYLSLPMVHFEEMFREMTWYNENKIDGILTQFHIPHWRVYGMNYFLMGRAARGEKKEEVLPFLYRRLYGKDREKGEKFWSKVKETVLSIGACHIPYPYSFLSRVKKSALEEIKEYAISLAECDREKREYKELVIWSEYLIRFKELFDTYHKGELAKKDVEEFLQWIHQYRESRIFVHDKFDMYFPALLEALEKKTKWLHFNLDWEDEYIRKHEESNFLNNMR